MVAGDWVIADSNANPSTKTPQCLFAVNQDNPEDVHQVCPWGKSLPVKSGATTSETPAAPGYDPQTSLIFVDDYFLKGVYAIHSNQRTGEMKVKWSRPDWWSSDYFTMVGPTDERVLVSQNIDPEHEDREHRDRFRLLRDRAMGGRGHREDDRRVRLQPLDGGRQPDQPRLRRALLHDGQRRLAVHLPGPTQGLELGSGGPSIANRTSPPVRPGSKTLEVVLEDRRAIRPRRPLARPAGPRLRGDAAEPEAIPAREPLSRPELLLLVRDHGDARRERADDPRALPVLPLLPVRALPLRPGHGRLHRHRREVRRSPARARPRLRESVRPRREPAGREPRLHAEDRAASMPPADSGGPRAEHDVRGHRGADPGRLPRLPSRRRLPRRRGGRAADLHRDPGRRHRALGG